MTPKKEDYLIGVDYGSTNIGVALGKNALVNPIKIIEAKNLQNAIADLTRLSIENKSVAFILGLPLGADGKETKKSLEVRRFAKLLKTASRKPVFFQNEYATTIGAEEEMIELEISQRKRRMKDHYSAALILKQYYDAM
jgi:putative Holliday junction resolvase